MKKKTVIGIIIAIALILVVIGAWTFFNKLLVWTSILVLVGIILYLLRETIYKALR